MPEDKTLIIAPSWIGDLVMAHGLIQAVQKHYPNTQQEVLALPWCKALTERMQEVTYTIEMPVGHGRLALSARYQLGKSLRNRHYARAFVLPNTFKSALIPFWARIKQRIGYRGEWRYGVLNEVHTLNKKQVPLMVNRYTALAEPEAKHAQHSPYYLPQLTPSAHNVHEALVKYHLALNQPILALCPGAEFGPSKQWPALYYAKVAQCFIEKGWQVWIFGSQKDKTIAHIITEHTPQAIDLTGRTHLSEAVDLLSCVQGVITNDSGLMHIASALNKPLIAIFGSTSPGFTPPLGKAAQVLQTALKCQPCFKRTCPLRHHQCMRDVSVAQVLSATETWE